MTLENPFHYPDEDLPFTLYFQGTAMGKYANYWPSSKIDNPYFDYIFERVWLSMDHTGLIESEESQLFIISAQHVLLWAIDHKDEFITEMVSDPKTDDFDYDSWISSICQMVSIS